jgi:hypothetical protein
VKRIENGSDWTLYRYKRGGWTGSLALKTLLWMSLKRGNLRASTKNCQQREENS